jgi:hypothetical protein
MNTSRLAVVGVAALLVAALVLAWTQFRSPAPEEEEPISFVFLLRQRRALSMSELQAAAERAFGLKFDSDPKATHFVRPTDAPGSFFVAAPRFTLLVLNVPKPYGEARTKQAGPQLEKAFQDHRAWLSVDWVERGDDCNSDEAFRAIGKLAAELAGDDCLALYCPRTRQMITHGPDLLPLLRGDQPLAAFAVERP